jgi:hypothetical protein
VQFFAIPAAQTPLLHGYAAPGPAAGTLGTRPKEGSFALLFPLFYSGHSTREATSVVKLILRVVWGIRNREGRAPWFHSKPQKAQGTRNTKKATKNQIGANLETRE